MFVYYLLFMKMKKRIPTSTDIEITISYANVKAYVYDEIFDDDEADKIQKAVVAFSREISIDKTYVAYKGTKYENTFLTEKGWKNLCKLLHDTDFGKNASAKQHEILQTSYYLMIISYIYMCLKEIGYESDGIVLELQEKSTYMVQIKPDTYKEYKRYPGKWQTW